MEQRLRILELHQKEFKRDADSLLDAWKEELAKRDKVVANEDGKFSASYIEEFKKNWEPKHDYAAVLEDLREKHETVIQDDLKSIRKAVDEMVNRPIRPEFASKIQSYAALDMANDLSAKEYELLKNDAQSFAELRILEKLAKSRSKSQNQVKMDDRGNARMERAEIADPLFFEIPSLDKLYDSLHWFEDSCLSAIKNYVGEYYELRKNPESAASIALAMNANKRLNGDTARNGEWLDIFNGLDNIKPRKTHLTEEEKSLLTSITGYNDLPYTAKDRAVEISKKSQELREMLLLDERFSDEIKKSEKEAV